ncbi:MAG: holo-ACP synthase [Alphaproteobacteria bacterium]
MIIGIGSDIIDIGRIEKTLARFGNRFVQRCFTPEEQAQAKCREGGGTHIDTYAKRFAAKEACAKALGTGFSQGVFMKDIGVVNEPGGRPGLHLTGGARARLECLTPPEKTPVLHLTLTDEKSHASAFVIIEAL